ncbi:hypothetical protein G5V59_27415 [Nocardioides sp. W3-2-3]|uniref:hypothetical protein n=1 Tax=Nocardioides convexus TaxID=2712224 RepID=UPI0024184BD8|nr:hypothetical protein [Nocardioides convexus]NHA02112.1 hypothetical protein [Nocardioides convexus]
MALVEEADRPPFRHVWVARGFEPARHQGFVMYRRPAGTLTEYYVKYVVDNAGAPAQIFEEWLPGHQPTPVRSSPNTGSAYG